MFSCIFTFESQELVCQMMPCFKKGAAFSFYDAFFSSLCGIVASLFLMKEEINECDK